MADPGSHRMGNSTVGLRANRCGAEPIICSNHAKNSRSTSLASLAGHELPVEFHLAFFGRGDGLAAFPTAR